MSATYVLLNEANTQLGKIDVREEQARQGGSGKAGYGVVEI